MTARARRPESTPSAFRSAWLVASPPGFHSFRPEVQLPDYECQFLPEDWYEPRRFFCHPRSESSMRILQERPERLQKATKGLCSLLLFRYGTITRNDGRRRKDVPTKPESPLFLDHQTPKIWSASSSQNRGL